jgi:hypothetical protein
MIRPFVYYPEMDALTCKQFVRSEADLFSHWINAESARSMYFASDSISVFTGNSNTVNWKLFDTEIKKRLTCFDNVSSCVRRNVVENLMFSDLSNTMNVNMDFGIRLLENSKKLGYLTSTGVYQLIPETPECVLKKVYSETKALNILVNGMPNFFELNDINLERIKTDIIRVYNLIQVTIVELGNIVVNPITAVKNFICTIRNNLNHNPDKIVSDFKETEVVQDGDLGILLRQMIRGKYSAQEHELNSAKNIIFSDFMKRFLNFSEYLCCKHTTLYGRQDDFVSSIYKIFAITVGEIMGSYHIESMTANNLSHELQEIDRLLKNDDRY